MKIGVLIGRFQLPEPHEGHRLIINRMLETFDQVIILVGSANRAQSVRNPFSYGERYLSIKNLYPKVFVYPLNDYKYSDTQWQVDVVNTVNYAVSNIASLANVEITLCGYWKEGNDYLKWFPQWKYLPIESNIDISGTEIRNNYRNLLPAQVQQDMQYFEQEALKFKDYPYPETLNFNCADALVECNGHVLLIERKFTPGAGTLALPGGFKNRNETFLDCAIRELIEETNIRVPEKVLRGSVISSRLFDSPNRSTGIPRSTLCVHMRIQPDASNTLPRAHGGDDAQSTSWVAIHNVLNKCKLYDDHSDIISVMTSTSPVPAYLNNNY